MTDHWHISADTGGTFTDLVGVDARGIRYRAKVLSSGCLRARITGKSLGGWLKIDAPWGMFENFFVGFRVSFPGGETFRVNEYRARDRALLLDHQGSMPVGNSVELYTGEEAPMLGARIMTRTRGDRPLPPMDLRLGTTRGTNALLERKGARVAFFITRGFGDLLEIRDQRRPDLFALNIQKPRPLTRNVIEVDERLDADGHVLQELRLDESFHDAVERAKTDGCQSAAITLLHAYRNPAHEEQLAEALREAGFKFVACSSELAPFIKVLPRAQTAVVDAYLGPIMGAYLDQVEGAMSAGRLRVMTSAGGLTMRSDYRAKDSLLSGPAGGVVGATVAGHRAGVWRIIAFDMGGTSTDVSRSEGDFDYRSSHRVGDATIVSPALKIETVAAGGGSVCGWDGRRLFVGPESAGAQPGPACYGAGGPLTITDVNLLLGRILPSAFSIPVFEDRARQAAQAVARQAGLSIDELLAGFLRIANERMAAAIETISVREGYDPKEYALVAFGGAGGLHACAIAEALGMATVIFPRDAGVLSAYGIAHAVVERIAEQELTMPLNEVAEMIDTRLDELASEPRKQLENEGVPGESIIVRQRRVTLRLAGQESTLTVDHCDDLAAAFQAEYEQVFGYFPSGRMIEVVSIQVAVSSVPPTVVEESFNTNCDSLNAPTKTSTSGARAYDREALGSGSRLQGPAIVYDDTSTLFIDEGWRGTVGSEDTLKLVNESPTAPSEFASEVVTRELFTNRFRQIVDEMGVQLERTAVSTNVKERLDFSCALLDGRGRLVVNAPHIPVHLGALGQCVRRVAEEMSLEPGDVVVTNHPGVGGSHLPDVTVITPVFVEGELLAYLANRAHHAEIGGIRPGSMPPNSKNLAEEGVVVSPCYLFRKNDSRLDAFEELLRTAPYPSRAINDNLADLNAQVAANRRGETQLRALVQSFGTDQVATYMGALLTFSADALSTEIAKLGFKSRSAMSQLDDGAEIHVSMDAVDGQLVIDFSGSSATQSGALNATPAIVSSAVIYVLRLMIPDDIPLNEGLLEPVSIKLPRCFLNPYFPDDPREAPAVVGGNVETSQRVVECCLRALNLVADSQGTSNNFIFGNDRISYYETIGGGAGAGNGFDGASGVHTHMTNTAITDVEILERRFPVRVREFSLRRKSGGEGRHRGGDGLVRELEFLEAVSVSLLTQHRTEGPSGACGGSSGKPGYQIRSLVDGNAEALPSLVDYDAVPGEVLRIETPGGGGSGA